MNIRVAHLYPDYLNIYADRGNIAVLAKRAAWRGHELEVTAIGLHGAIDPRAYDLYYLGGGQGSPVTAVAPDFAAKAEPLKTAVEDGAAVLAVCGGYQLLGRGYRGFHGEDMPGVGGLPLETIAGDRRMIGDVLIDSHVGPVVGFENHAGRTHLDPGAQPLGRVVSGFGNDGKSGFEGCRHGRVVGTYPRGRCSAQPTVGRLGARAGARASHGGEPPESSRSTTSSKRKRTQFPPAASRTRGGKSL